MSGRKRPRRTDEERAKREAKRQRRSVRLEAEARAALDEILKQDRKRRHHTVWRKYLEAWSDESGSVWCQQDGNRFTNAPANLGLRKDFYRLQEINDDTLRWIERLVIEPMPDVRDRRVARRWIPKFREAFELRDLLKRGGINNAEIEEAIEITICNAEEDMHAEVERTAGSLLASLQGGNATSLDDDATYADFAQFLGLQYMRTPTIAMRTIEALRGAPGFDAAAAWGLIRTIFATNIAKAIYLSRKQTRLCFLEPAAGSLFVTGDQPVLNLGKTERMELYYPLSPARALVLSPDAGKATTESMTLGAEEVHRYNVLIRDAAMQVYAESEPTLLRTFS